MGYKSFEELEVYKAAREFRKEICIDEKYFEQGYLEELKDEGYRINKMLNGYIGYLKKRKSGETNKPINQSTIQPS